MYFLAVDVGNTNISLGIFDDFNDRPLFTFSIATDRNKTEFEYLIAIKTIFDSFNFSISSVVSVKIASVVPELNRILLLAFALIKPRIDVKLIESADFMMQFNVQNKSEVGVDRIVNSFAATTLCCADCIIVDFGTATTIDIAIKEAGYIIYEGGIILPGVALSLEALRLGTSKLPKVSLKMPDCLIGKTTTEAINSGIFYGYPAMISGLIAQIRENYKDRNFRVIITGGVANLFNRDLFHLEYLLEPELTLLGINLSHKNS